MSRCTQAVNAPVSFWFIPIWKDSQIIMRTFKVKFSGPHAECMCRIAVGPLSPQAWCAQIALGIRAPTTMPVVKERNPGGWKRWLKKKRQTCCRDTMSLSDVLGNRTLFTVCVLHREAGCGFAFCPSLKMQTTDLECASQFAGRSLAIKWLGKCACDNEDVPGACGWTEVTAAPAGSWPTQDSAVDWKKQGPGTVSPPGR